MKKTISRRKAINLRLPKYYTGKPCINGHIAERYTEARSCVRCVIERVNRSREKMKRLADKAGGDS